MTLQQILQARRNAIAQRWLDGALQTYPKDSAALFAREKDPFANPVGHSLREGIQGILDDLLGGRDVEQSSERLRDMMKIRAVQQFTASQAVGFVFLVKEAVRAELGEAAAEPQLSQELTKLESQIDRIALAAFDCYVACRQQVYELRVNELKRQIPWAVSRMNQQDSGPEFVQIESKRDGGNVRREGLR